MEKTKIVNIIKEILEERERSIRWLAKKIEVPHMTLYNYVKNKRVIPSDILFKVAEVFDCTTDELLKKIPNPEIEE